MSIRFIINAEAPFNGGCVSHLLPNGCVAYTDGLTFEQYQAKASVKLKVVDEDEFDDLLRQYELSLVTPPKLITAEQWWYALEILPPRRWHHHLGVELFHVPEHITGKLVDWYAKLNGKYYHFVDVYDASSESLAAKVANA